MRVIVDMDEVLANFVSHVLGRWNMTNMTKFTREDINSWQMEETLGPGSYRVIENWISRPGFFENLDPMPGAVEGFKKLMDMGHEIVICTSLAPEISNGYDGKRRWMHRHWPTFNLNNFICTSKKHMLKADVLIDDASHYLKAWREAGNVQGVIMDARWNRDLDIFPRARNWQDILDIVEFYDYGQKYLNVKNKFHDRQRAIEKDRALRQMETLTKMVEDT